MELWFIRSSNKIEDSITKLNKSHLNLLNIKKHFIFSRMSIKILIMEFYLSKFYERNMDVVVIGNGFDLFHELKTSYNNFKMYLTLEHPECIQQVEEFIDIESNALWNNLEASLAKIDYEMIYEKASALLESYGSDDWKDRYHHDFQYEIWKSLSFTNNLAKYAKEWINSIEMKSNKILQEFTFENVLFISFNYTDTLEEFYKIPENNIFYIHGKAKRDNGIILGHNAECYCFNQNYISDDIRIQEGNIILNQSQKNLKKPSEEIISTNKNYFETMVDVKNIYILGHSLSEVDDIYFINMIKYIPKNCKWFISYYNDKSNIDEFIKRHNINSEVNKIKIEDFA